MFKGKCINPQGSNTDLLVSKTPETIHLSPCYLPGGGVPDKKRGAESRNLGVPSAQINKTDESKHKDWSLLPCATRIRSNYNELETPRSLLYTFHAISSKAAQTISPKPPLCPHPCLGGGYHLGPYS